MPERSGRPRKVEDGPKYSVRAVERAIAVLNAFSFDRAELSLVEIAKETGLSKPTAFRLLATLEQHRYVAVDPARARYRLGPKLLELGGTHQDKIQKWKHKADEAKAQGMQP